VIHWTELDANPAGFGKPQAIPSFRGQLMAFFHSNATGDEDWRFRTAPGWEKKRLRAFAVVMSSASRVGVPESW
jgi:hypothetical protein